MSDRICPECETANPESEDICLQCAYPLDEPSALVAVLDELSCSACGKAVADDMRFCDGCGNPLNQTPDPIPQATQSTPAPEPDLRFETDPLPMPDPVQVADPVPSPPAINVSPIPDPEPAPAVPSPMKHNESWKLSVVEGHHIGKEYLLYKEEMIVGRIDAESGFYPDLDLEDQDDGYVSRRHAMVRIKDGLVTVEDLGGDNGTLIQNRRIPPTKPFPLTEGQLLRVGKVGLLLKIHHNG